MKRRVYSTIMLVCGTILAVMINSWWLLLITTILFWIITPKGDGN